MSDQYTYFLNAALLFFFGLLAPVNHGAAANPCTGTCILQRASTDQNCAIEQTPLVRCEKFSEFEKRDADLNTTYKAVYSTLDESGRSNLRQVQRKWMRWRDETCDDAEAEANCTNGMCVGVAHDSCIVRLTERRYNELKQIASKHSNVIPHRFNYSQSPLNNGN